MCWQERNNGRRGVYKGEARTAVSLSGLRWIGGGYLLSRLRSTIGAAGFNFSVRNGKRWSPRAMAALVRLSVIRCVCQFFVDVVSLSLSSLFLFMDLLMPTCGCRIRQEGAVEAKPQSFGLQHFGLCIQSFEPRGLAETSLSCGCASRTDGLFSSSFRSCIFLGGLLPGKGSGY